MRTLRPIAVLALTTAALAQKQPPASGPPPNLPPGLYAVINTSMGTITAELYEKIAPITVRNFVALSRGTRQWLDPKTHMPVTRALYDNITFHRVIPDFMIQTGDPTGTGAYNCGFTLPDEIGSLRFDQAGRLAMANKGPNTGDCQFFITSVPTPWLNGKHTIFGQVVDGQKVVEKIGSVFRDEHDKPRFPVKLVGIQIVRVAQTAAARPPSVTAPGLFVNAEGDVLTRYEVVQGCTQIRVGDSEPLRVAYFDRQNDLALLRTGRKTDSFVVIGEGDLQVAGNTVKPAVATGFLEANGVPYQTAGSPPADGGKAMVEIQCWK